jgi:hypothetical protein
MKLPARPVVTKVTLSMFAKRLILSVAFVGIVGGIFASNLLYSNSANAQLPTQNPNQPQTQMLAPDQNQTGDQPEVMPLPIDTFSTQVMGDNKPAQAINSVNTTNQVISNEISVVATPIKIGEDRSLLLKPGERRQIELRVRNVSSRTVDIVTSAQDFIVDEDGVTPIPIKTTDVTSNRWSLANWLTIVPNMQTVAPNEIVGLNVLIEVPADALPGGRYAMVVHEPMPEGSTARNADGSLDEASSQSRVSQKVGTLIYVVVDGPINESAFLRDLKFPRFTEFGPIPFSMSVDNQSDIHITPQITVEIRNMFGAVIDTITLQPRNVFPLMSREFEGQWDRVWGWGLYRATATMSYGDNGQIAITHSNFWFLPITLLLGIGVGILSAVAILIAIHRHLVHRNNQDRARIQELERKLQQMADPEKPTPPTM